MYNNTANLKSSLVIHNIKKHLDRYHIYIKNSILIIKNISNFLFSSSLLKTNYENNNQTNINNETYIYLLFIYEKNKLTQNQNVLYTNIPSTTFYKCNENVIVIRKPITKFKKVFGNIKYDPRSELNRHNNFQSFSGGIMLLFR